MRISKPFKIKFLCVIGLAIWGFSPVSAAMSMRVLGDSLMAYTGFSKRWAPMVKVKQLRVNEDSITIRTNATLGHFRWTPENVEELKKRTCKWVLGKKEGGVAIFSDNHEISELITDCARGIGPEDGNKGLKGRNIAIWPSHGLYFNHELDTWVWQRATLWTTVEDLYSHEYVRLIKQMLENAGARVFMPRAGVECQDTGISGLPRWAEGARYNLQAKGAGSYLWKIYQEDEYRDDMKCRPKWVNALKGPIDLCLAVHTDGGTTANDSDLMGTLLIYTAKDDDGNTALKDGRDRETENRNLADWLQTQLVEDLQQVIPNWTRRQLKEANYCESRVPVMPSALIEILSHQNMPDMKYGLDPKFRFRVARGIYKGMLRYLNGESAVVQPLPVEQIAIRHDGTVKWIAKEDPLEKTAKATFYKLFIQENDSAWTSQRIDKGTEYKLDMTKGTRYNVYVVACNAGGSSFPSPTVSAYRSGGSKTALIIDGFNDVYGPEWFSQENYAGIVPGSYACEEQFTCAYIGEQWDFRRDSKWINDDECGFGACYRDFAGTITKGNTHDWSAQHGRVLQDMKISYTSSTRGMAVIDSALTFVDYICGRQREPVNDKTLEQLEKYLSQGGSMLLSSEYLSRLDTAWIKYQLHTSFRAERTTRTGQMVIKNAFKHAIQPTDKDGKLPKEKPTPLPTADALSGTINLAVKPNAQRIFTPKPESLTPEEGSVRLMDYMDARCCGAVGWVAPDSIVEPEAKRRTKTLVYGFPLEAVEQFDDLYRHSVKWLITQ